MIGDLNIDNMITDVKVTKSKINQQSKRSLSGKLHQSWATIKSKYTITYTELSQTEYDSIVIKFQSQSNFTFIDHRGITISNCQITSADIEGTITWDINKFSYYTFSLVIEEQ